MNSVTPQATFCADQGHDCVCQGSAYYGTLDQMFNIKTSDGYSIKHDVGGKVNCNRNNFSNTL